MGGRKGRKKEKEGMFHFLSCFLCALNIVASQQKVWFQMQTKVIHLASANSTH